MKSVEGGVDYGWLNEADPVVSGRLQEELERVDQADPFGVLGVPYEADAAAIRKAFLARTKVFHPNRFARRDPEVRRLAHEIFLRVKKAYSRIESEEGRKKVLDRLGKDAGPKQGFADTVQTAIPVSINGEVGSGAISKNPRAPTSERAAVNTRVSFTSPRRATTQKPASPASPAAPARPGSNGAGQGAAKGSASGSKSESGSRAAAARRRLATSRRERLRQQLAPSGAAGEQPARRAPTGDPDEVVARVGQQAEEQQEKFKRGRQLVREGKLSEAKETFRELAVANPTEKKYRVYMHYAWGREHQAANRNQEARAEYNRALTLDAAFEPARRSMDTLPSSKKDKEGGLFSKLFRK